MDTVRRALGLAIVPRVTAAFAVRAHLRSLPDESSSAASGESQAFLASPGPQDPDRAYFTGHWGNCWRKQDVLPPEASKQSDGALPRAVSPPPREVRWSGCTTRSGPSPAPETTLSRHLIASLKADSPRLWGTDLLLVRNALLSIPIEEWIEAAGALRARAHKGGARVLACGQGLGNGRR